MPIYPYICESCSYEFDRLQKISEDPLKTCPECGTESLRKKLTAAAFHLKGTGWYETDFKDKKSEKKTDDGKDGKKGHVDKKSDAKSGDSKPAGSSADTGSSKGGGNKSATSESPG